jgi:GNAT superfamily N-acetyltransferase
MFIPSSLAALIDRSEARLCADWAAGVEARGGPGGIVQPIGGGLAVYVAPSSPVNKVIGLGFDGPLDEAALEEVERLWRERNEPVRVEMSILAHPLVGSRLTARGYHLHGFENVLGRRLDDLDAFSPASGITVETLRAGDEATWVDIAVDAFMDLDGTGSGADDSLPRDVLRRAIDDFAGGPGFVRYLARVDGVPVGEAAMRIEGTLAQVAGAGTLPAWRGRGVQKALLHRRLSDARDRGCEIAVVTTAPGSRSQENVMRRGFALLYTRAILIRGWQDPPAMEESG